jgi:hypothetical protein
MRFVVILAICLSVVPTIGATLAQAGGPCQARQTCP